ncbi:MAG: hypothetical protein K940chlam9_01912, partial [Chlamydiae bacterium]|nr:hypothetical protein [Chlamydiota bacterium]
FFLFRDHEEGYYLPVLRLVVFEVDHQYIDIRIGEVPCSSRYRVSSNRLAIENDGVAYFVNDHFS